MRLFALVALFLVLIAIVNFVNLATVRSVNRAKEVGVRKSVGAQRGLLVQQFLGESLLITVLALLLAFLLTSSLLPYFNQLKNKQMELPVGQPWFWVTLLGLGLLTGLLAGFFPHYTCHRLIRYRYSRVIFELVRVSERSVKAWSSFSSGYPCCSWLAQWWSISSWTM